MDLRKKENPRNHLVGFKTDKATQQRIRNEAERVGMNVSEFVHETMKKALA
jgi:hypothetical protein